MSLRIANAAGFLGDWLDAPRRLLEHTEVDYLTLEYLAELTLSILAWQREKNPELGYAQDFLEILQSIIPSLQHQPQLKIITNAGGMNPQACVQQAAKQLVAHGLSHLKVAAISGDDLLSQLPQLIAAGHTFSHFDTGASLPDIAQIVSANAYLGAEPIVQALEQGAHIVITGRVADASLCVAPAVHTFATAWNDWKKLAGYSVAGHLIECGAQVTGGYSVDWHEFDLANVGYPIAELEANGDCVITKPPRTGGAVTHRTVAEQLVYEIGDPQHYLTPNVDCDFTTVQIHDTGNDRVMVSGASGQAPPETYKVSLAYRNGYFASGMLFVVGNDAIPKAHCCADIVHQRLRSAGFVPEHWHVELLGTGDGALQHKAEITNSKTQELMLRLTVHDSRRNVVERFTREIAPLITNGPAGLAGYAAGRPAVQPVYAYWPTRIAKNVIVPQVQVKTAAEWSL